MAFEIPKETNPGKISEVTIGATPGQGGTRSHTITIGGSTALPFHFFEGEHPQRPAVAMEVFDVISEKYPPVLRELYGELLERPAAMRQPARR